MKKFNTGIIIFIVFHFFSLCLYSTVLAQTPTPGLIYKPATNGGNKILDPNGDGYVSLTQIGFPGVNQDEGAEYSEIPYKPFPIFMDEPLSDLGTGANGGHTDYAPKTYSGTTPIGSPLAAHFDGTNFLFRIRLGGQSTASKGYSILIDANSDLNGTGKNPGFEYEVVLCTNYDVRVYYHGTSTSTRGPIIFSGTVDQFSQKAIASSVGGGDPDYFYDFYIPLSVFNQAIPIFATTPIRMTGVTVTSANSGLFGTASDIGGVDDNKYSGNFLGALRDIINNTPSSTPTGIQSTGFTPVKAAAPYVNGPITKTGSSTINITGYSVEKEGSLITVYQNGVSIGTTLVLANGTWSLPVNNSTLVVDRFITATVKPIDKSLSDLSNAVKVQQSTCFNLAPPTIIGVTSGNKGIYGSTSVTGLIKIYAVGSSTVLFSGTVSAGNEWKAEWGNNGGAIPSGTYFATVTVDGCESNASNQLCFSAANQGNGQSTVTMTTAPTITPASITSSTATIRITGPAGSTLTLTKNGVQIATATLGTSANTTSTEWTITLTGLVNGDILYARATSGSPCTATSGRSNAATVTITTTPVQSTAPTITGNYCGTTTNITGTSSEAPGTTIRLFNSTTQIGTTTTNAFGSWSISGLSIPGGSTLTARALAPNKTESVASAPVTIGSVYSGSIPVITSSDVIEGETLLMGTAANGSIITLYINGDPLVKATGDDAGSLITTTTNNQGIWEFNNISPFDFYAGARLTVTAKTSVLSACESAHSAAVTVQCKAASQGMTSSFEKTSVVTTTNLCPGTKATVYLSSSEIGTIYNIYKKETNSTYTQFGASVLGTGNALTLVSDYITASGTILQVRTIKVGAPCQYNIGSELTANFYPPVPNTYVVTGTNTSGCPGLTTQIKLQNAETGYSYQLINNDTKDNVGELVVPDIAGDINFPEIAVHVTTNYSVIITRLDGGCIAQNINSNTVTITRSGPTVNQVVSQSATAICPGQSVSFSFATQSNYTYRLYDKSSNTTVIQSITGNGGQMSLSTGNIGTTGIKTYRIEVTGAGCISNLITEPSVNVTSSPAIDVNAGPDATVCGNSTTLQGSDPAPGTGAWSVVSKPTGAANPTFSSNTATNPVVSGLTSGNYVFRWTISTTCGTLTSTSDEVTITINCPATLVVGTTKFYNEYVTGDILATISDDTDGGIISFTAINGIRPPGSDFAIENSKLALKVTTAPSNGGSYSFTMQTTDARGVTTNTPMLIRMYKREGVPGGITPFPVELMYFKAAAEKHLVVLNWETASEKNNDRFEVQRSVDGKRFYTIGSVKGNGTTSRSVKYSFEDTDPLHGLAYYRLKQIDYNGEPILSQLASVKFRNYSSDIPQHTIKAYPNPFVDQLTADIHVAENSEAIMQVIDMQGRVVLSDVIKLKSGNNSLDVTLPGSRRGMYILKVTGSSFGSSTKIVKAE